MASVSMLDIQEFTSFWRIT